MTIVCSVPAGFVQRFISTRPGPLAAAAYVNAQVFELAVPEVPFESFGARQLDAWAENEFVAFMLICFLQLALPLPTTPSQSRSFDGSHVSVPGSTEPEHAPQTVPPPATYSDTVVITVEY